MLEGHILIPLYEEIADPEVRAIAQLSALMNTILKDLSTDATIRISDWFEQRYSIGNPVDNSSGEPDGSL